jgi:starch synthase
MGLDVSADTPIVGVVSRLVEQKGLDLLLEAAPAILDDGGRIALLGSGEAWLEDAFVDLAMANPGMVAVRIGFDGALAQRIYAGCDAFAMPSRFEPCGLGQLIAMRYGAVPLVRRTGGLADTVSAQNGFLFDEPTPQALAAAFEELATAFRDPAAWRSLQLAGMAYDSSWDASARAYSDLFAELAG